MANKDFSKKLKSMRLKAGYNQKEVYEHFGIPQSTFSSWEVGKSEPPGDMLFKLCEFYKCDMIKELSTNEGDNVTYAEWEMIEKYRVLDPHGKKMVDFTLNEEWERSTAIAKENASKENLVSISKYTKEGENENNTVEFSEELIPEKDYLLPNAAHADESLTEITEEIIQVEENIMDDENF